MEEIKSLFKDVVAAEVLVLAHQIKADKAAKGVRSSGDCVYDAVNLLRRKREEVLRRLL